MDSTQSEASTTSPVDRESTVGPSSTSPSTTHASQHSSTSPNPSTSSPPTTVATDQTQALYEARAAVTATLSSVGAHIDSDLQSRASDIHTNASAISAQDKALREQTAELAKSSGTWQKEMDASLKKMKELGDVQNWAEVLERDLLVLEETVRLVEGRVDEGLASGTNPPLGGVGSSGNGKD